MAEAFSAGPIPNAPQGQPNPFFGSNYDPNDGKPIYICAVDSFASYLVLMQMQVIGKDIEHGFHLGIVPYSIGPDYEIEQATTEANLQQGVWDCDIGTVDTVARSGYGVVTAVLDESAGGDGIYARNISSIYALAGKKLGYVSGNSSELFARYALRVAQLTPQTVSLVPYDDVIVAAKAFADGEVDAFSGWDPYLKESVATGGKPLLTTDQLRIIVDVVLTSRRSIETKPNIVQSFHDALFDTLKVQLESFDQSASFIAAWGHNEWTAISKENAAEDLRVQMASIAQASLQDNVQLMGNLTPIYNQLEIARLVWQEAGPLPGIDVKSLINPQFVLQANTNPKLQTSANPVNDTFSLISSATATTASVSSAVVISQAVSPTSTASLTTTTLPTATGITSAATPTVTETSLAVLPCTKFTFTPDSAELSDESRRVIDFCVVPALQQRPQASLRIVGSAAWPGPAGTYTEQKISAFARRRAQAVASYLVSQGIDATRLRIEGVLPRADHRETLDAAQQDEDRYVQLTLISNP